MEGTTARGKLKSSRVFFFLTCKFLIFFYLLSLFYRHLSDIHIYDVNNRVWSPLNVISDGTNNPIPRDSHIAISHSNSMYIFGGSTGSAMNDFYELNLSENTPLEARW